MIINFFFLLFPISRKSKNFKKEESSFGTIINNEIRKLYPLDEPLELENYILLLKYEIFITKLIEIYETEYANNDDIHYFTIYNEIKALLDAIQEPDEKTSGLFSIINNYLSSLEISESKQDEFRVDLEINSDFIQGEIKKAKKN